VDVLLPLRVGETKLSAIVNRPVWMSEEPERQDVKFIKPLSRFRHAQ
jgi:hypothetical protein